MIRWTLIASIAVNAVCRYFDGETTEAVLSALCVGALLINRRVGAAITAVVYLLTTVSAHEYLIMSIAAILALFPSPRQMVLLLKVQLTVMWVFTGIAKLHPAFRSGRVFERGPLLFFDHLPINLVIWGTIVIELIALPVLLWWKPKVAFWVALVFQTSVYVGMFRYRSAWSFEREFSFRLSLLSFEIAVMGAALVVTLLWPRVAAAAPGARRAHAR
ncbi:MAG: hypothetical protein F2520_07160 [Actinobacteria bacterium]|uniref:Unannotated protein n=1 Tax=freshwater metagenome TaxID=449393 RepID=A0A6J5YBX2_9ZZZZ|nr:hypothetical protein [Actinomycetota bacterium]